MSKTAQNTRKTPRGKPFQKGGDPRINAGGRPKNKKSITYWLREFGSMTPAAVAQECETYADELRKGGDALPFFALIAIRMLMTLGNDPDPRMLAEVWDRLEGKVPNPVEISGPDKGPLTVKAFDYGSAVAAIATGPVIDHVASGAHQSYLDGPALGKDDDGG